MYAIIFAILVITLGILIWSNIHHGENLKNKNKNIINKNNKNNENQEDLLVYKWTPDNEQTVSMMDFNASDPKLRKYSDRSRDILGMDGRDYFMENDMLYRSGAQNQPVGDGNFHASSGGINTVLYGQRGNGFVEFDDMYWDLPKGISLLGSVESAEDYVGGSSPLDNTASF